jgi:RNA polymerase sigma factor (sigma-70 family)
MPGSTDVRPCAAQPIREAGVLGVRSDEDLVALLRQGQQSAFEILATRYHGRLLSFCWRILRSREDAEDALQDVLSAAFRAIVADEREIQVRPWLYRIARNRCINELRRSKAVGVDSLDDYPTQNGSTPVEELVRRQLLRELVDDVQALTDMQRTALLLREFDGLAYQQIATAMDTTIPAVKSLLVRARAGLRDSSTIRAANFAALVCAPATGIQSSGARAIGYTRAVAAASVAA